MCDEWRYRPADRARVEALRSILERFESADQGSAERRALAVEFREASGREYLESDLENYWRSTDVETFLEEAAQPRAAKLKNVRRSDLVSIVKALMEASDEAEQGYYMRLFDAQVTRPRAWSLVFHPPSGLGSESWDPSPEEVVELALAYRPIEL